MCKRKVLSSPKRSNASNSAAAPPVDSDSSDSEGEVTDTNERTPLLPPPAGSRNDGGESAGTELPLTRSQAGGAPAAAGYGMCAALQRESESSPRMR